MRHSMLCAAFLAVVALAAEAQGEIEPRIGLRSEAVICQELQHAGITPDRITIHGEMARVETRVNGQPAVLEVDRLGGGIRLLTDNPAVRAELAPKLSPSAVVRPQAVSGEIRTLTPGVTRPMDPGTIRAPETRIENLRPHQQPQ